MKAQAVLSSAMTLGPFLTSMLLSREANVEDEGSRKVSSDSKALPGVVIRSASEALEAHSSQPAMVDLGPMLTLLMTLQKRGLRRTRLRWQGPTLPPGCVMVRRYASR